MTNMIPALPGTTLIDQDGGVVAVVVGWQYIQGSMVFPLFPFAQGGVSDKQGIYHPDGMVSYPAKQMLFQDVGAFTDWIGENVEDAQASAPVEGSGPDLTPIVFGTKTFKGGSFWHWPAANALFYIEGKQPLPNDTRVEKVNRDKWYEIKREFKATKIDPHSGVIQEEPDADSPQPVEDDNSDVI